MTEPIDREAIRRRARAKVVELGYPLKPEPEDTTPAAEPLPTLVPGALRALMQRGHLTPGQMISARALFAEARRLAATDPDGDAA